MRLAGPDVNYIEASKNFGNLESAMEYFQAHDNEAEEIARNSHETFARRYLTPAAVSLLVTSRPERIIDTTIGYLLLEKTVLDVGFGPRLRAATIRAR